MLKAGFVLDGKYRILSVIGQGGMSTVYLAVHERLKQKWAVKEISMEYCENYEDKQEANSRGGYFKKIGSSRTSKDC